jgi:hypothetical protein
VGDTTTSSSLATPLPKRAFELQSIIRLDVVVTFAALQRRLDEFRKTGLGTPLPITLVIFFRRD